jgi:hypothetical protein
VPVHQLGTSLLKLFWGFRTVRGDSGGAGGCWGGFGRRGHGCFISAAEGSRDGAGVVGMLLDQLKEERSVGSSMPGQESVTLYI